MDKIILVVTDNQYEQINGVVTTFKNIEEFAKSDGYSIVYLDPRKFYHVDCPGYPEVKLSLPWKIGSKIKAFNPTHIHIATEGPIGVAARIWCDLNKIKYNTSYHTKFPEFLNALYKIPVWLTYAYLKWFHTHSGIVLTTTQTMVENLTLHGFTNKVIAWTRGVDSSIFSSSLRIPKLTNKIVLLSVGRVSKEKGLDDFCSIPYPNSSKIVVGDGPYKTELQAKYPDVLFVGSKVGVELAEYFANADVFVFTSKSDTFGIVIIESLRSGTPVAAYHVDGPKDIIQQGINGYMHECLTDSITDCLTLSREQVESSSVEWSWNNCWIIFKENLIQR